MTMITIDKGKASMFMAKAGFNGVGFADAVEISPCYANLLLNGKRHASPPLAKRMCEVLKCDFNDIFAINKDNKK